MISLTTLDLSGRPLKQLETYMLQFFTGKMAFESSLGKASYKAYTFTAEPLVFSEFHGPYNYSDEYYFLFFDDNICVQAWPYWSEDPISFHIHYNPTIGDEVKMLELICPTSRGKRRKK
jgi:hypothetical protein